jgi:hypothetical protein
MTWTLVLCDSGNLTDREKRNCLTYIFFMPDVVEKKIVQTP